MTSSRVTSNIHFLKLLIKTNNIQAIALLETITDEQVDSVCEIILNLSLGNIIKIDDTVKRIIYTKRRIINILKDRKINKRRRSNTIKSHPKVVLELMKLVKNKIGKI